ncbi:hypothetical protein AVEN_4857-1 [Araneus ventricosus]|uniref:Uncharacterized protein n=1 Tax=Araneus ventricosus TaxID=182803 RepID=A0A4Y2FFL3_ARAVE|nr:hypothetical protein AVEN_4857-1 [Araneus ventricosus]
MLPFCAKKIEYLFIDLAKSILQTKTAETTSRMRILMCEVVDYVVRLPYHAIYRISHIVTGFDTTPTQLSSPFHLGTPYTATT